MSIRLKLTNLFLAIASIPLLFVSALTFVSYRNSLEAARLSQLQDLAVFRADRIDAYFSGLKGHIEIAQGYYNIRKNLPVLTRLANDPNNPEFVAAKKMLDGQLQQMQSVSDLTDIMLVSPEGKIVYSSNPKHYPADFSKALSDPEQKAFNQGKEKVCFSDVYFDKKQDNRFEVLLTAPACDLNGVPSGVIAFEVDMTPAYKLIQDVTGLGETGEVLVGKRVGDQVEYLNPLRHDPQAALKRRVAFGEGAGLPMQEAVQGRTGLGQSLDYRGTKVVAAWRYIPSMDWGMVAKIDAEEAFADVTRLRHLTMVILAIVLVIGGIMAYYIAQSIAEPIKRLSRGAEIIGSGNLDYKLGSSQNDEIGQLSRSFDKMTMDLKLTTASRDELNKEIVERRQAEEALRESEQRLKYHFENSPLAVVEWDANFIVTQWSNEAQQIFGWKREEVLGKRIDSLNMIYHEDIPIVESTMKRLTSGKESAVVSSNRNLTRSGDVIECVWHNSVLLNADGQMESIMSLVEDITKRKQAEEAVLASEVRYRRLFEAARDGILILDAESGRIVDVNPFIKNILGYSHDELLDRSIWDVGPFKNIVASKEAFLELQTKGYIRYENMPLETKDGRRISVEFVSNVYMVDQKKVIQCNIRDITERVKAEETLRLTRDDLVRSNKDLEQFAYVASHDLQEPLRAVAGFVELLRRSLQGSLDARMTGYMDFAVDGAKRMQALVNGLLEYSRIGTHGEKHEDTDAKAALEMAMMHLRATIQESGAEVTADELPKVHFDVTQLVQLFQNLVGNAIKFRGKETPRIHISATRNGDGWQLAVSDNGIGIEPEYAERIFLIFQRLHDREKYPGTGIGLAICKKIVEHHNGKIWVESKPGIGSTFYFTIPDKGTN